MIRSGGVRWARMNGQARILDSSETSRRTCMIRKSGISLPPGRVVLSSSFKVCQVGVPVFGIVVELVNATGGIGYVRLECEICDSWLNCSCT